MAINTYRFWMATDANRLLANQNAFIQASAPSFYQGNVAQLELHIVASAGVGTSPVEIPFPAGAAISVAVGDTNTYPTGGTWELMVGTTETQPMPYNATTTQVASALNALSEVSTAGGVTVSKTGDGYTITWNTYGLKPSIGIGSDTLTPSSYESISLVQEGNSETRQIVFVELRQNPIALGVDWTALPTPSVTVSEVQAWNGTNRIWRVSIDPQPKAGTITISYGSKTATLAYNASASNIAAALSPAQVFATGQYQWDIVIAEDSVLTSTGSLVGYNGFTGSINFATSECHQFLAGAERKSTVLEVSISVDSKRYTLIQTPCNVFADVVSDGVIVPLPLGTAMSEQVANNRFVRRDSNQSPDGATQNQIWRNIGLVSNDGTDVVAALSYASSPSFGNPFATISDIPAPGVAHWGDITGTLSDQTDLQTELDGKYPNSNPSGYIQDANADSNLYGRKDGAWELIPSLSGYATESWVMGQGYLTSSDLSGYATESWVTGQGYVTSDAISDMATMSWVNGQGFVTYGAISDMATMSWVTGQGYATESFVTSQGFLQFDAYNRLNFAGGYNPDPSPIAGRFWFQSDKFRYSTSTAQLNALASETYVDGQLYTKASVSGATFTGKVNFTSVSGAAGLNVGIGGTSAASTVNGDLWISTGGTNLNFRDGTGSWRILVNTSNTNVFSASQVIDTTASTPALRVTQKGTGASLLVEDSVNPDGNAFVVDTNGNLGVGVDPSAWSASNKVEVMGAVKAQSITFDGTAQFKVTGTQTHGTGADTHDLLISFNGSTYRIPMIFVSTP